MAEKLSLLSQDLKRAPIKKKYYSEINENQTIEIVRKKSRASPTLQSILLASNESERRKFLSGTSLRISLLCFHFAFGTLGMMMFEKWPAYDALYFCVVTTTTVGYGDLYPESALGKCFVIFYSLSSMFLIFSNLAYFVTLFIDRQERILINTINEEIGEDTGEGKKIRILLSTEALTKALTRSLIISSVILLSIVITGTLVFKYVEGHTWLDSFYATIISSTTIGYGDLTPVHMRTKLIMTVWLVVSTISFAKVLSDFTDMQMQAEERDAARRILADSLKKTDLNEFDLDGDGRTTWCEYALTVMVSLGKISQEEVDQLKSKFEEINRNKLEKFSKKIWK